MSLRRSFLVLAVTAVVVAGGSITVIGTLATESLESGTAPTHQQTGGEPNAETPENASTATAGRPVDRSDAVGTAPVRWATDTEVPRAAAHRTSASVDRIEFLEVRSTGDGEYAYRLTVRGYLQKARVNDQLKSESNDVVQRHDNGTVTVVGTTGNGQSDAYTYVGEVVAFEKIRGDSDGRLFLNGLAVSRDELLNADIFEVVSNDEGREVRYEFRVEGSVERTRTGEKVAAGNNDRIERNDDGTVTVRGVTGNAHGDAYRIRGTILSFRTLGGESDYDLRLDGLEVDADSLNGEGANGTVGDNGESDDVRTIDDCTRIDEPGVYRLSADLRDEQADSCIEIVVGDVVLDGDGHRIDGVNATGSVGIAITPNESDPVRNVTVRDVQLTDWDTGVQAGTRSASVAALTFEEVTSSGNRDTGLRLIDADESRVAGSTFRDNGGTGVVFDEFGSETSVVDTTIADNGGYGLLLFDGSSGFVARNVEVTGNRLAGIKTSNGERGLLVTESLVAENGGAGIDLDDSSAPTIEGNRVLDNGGAGVDAEDVSSPSLRDNEITGNAGDGIAIQQTSDTVVVGNAVRLNDGSGISLSRVSRGWVLDNVICENGEPQISVGDDVEDIQIAENTVGCE